jgi:transposase
MYRDVVQWSKIRHRILVKGDSRRQVARETGISTNTIDKMVAHRLPQTAASGAAPLILVKQLVAQVLSIVQDKQMAQPDKQKKTAQTGRRELRL